MRQGVFVGRFSDDCADQVPLFTTATAGELDDATVSNCLVAGVTNGPGIQASSTRGKVENCVVNQCSGNGITGITGGAF